MAQKSTKLFFCQNPVYIIYIPGHSIKMAGKLVPLNKYYSTSNSKRLGKVLLTTFTTWSFTTFTTSLNGLYHLLPPGI